MDKIINDSEANEFLRNLTLKVGRDVVSRVTSILTGKSDDSFYELYANRRRRDGSIRTPVCGKGTVYKITNLYKIGKLDPYLIYLDNISQATVAGGYGNLDSIKQESLTQAEHAASTEELAEIKPLTKDQFNQENEGYERIDIVDSQGKYSEEWGHYDKIKEAIINLQYISDEQVRELLDIITRERVTLDDSSLQKYLDEFIEAIHETMSLGLCIPHYLINPVISRTSRRMNKRYKRRK